MLPSLKAQIMGLDPENYMLPCLSKQVLDMECPGCGLQRSIVLLFQGEVGASLQMYPGLLPMMALFGFMALNRFIPFRRANTVIVGLAGLTVLAILGNFLLKIIN